MVTTALHLNNHMKVTELLVYQVGVLCNSLKVRGKRGVKFTGAIVYVEFDLLRSGYGTVKVVIFRKDFNFVNFVDQHLSVDLSIGKNIIDESKWFKIDKTQKYLYSKIILYSILGKSNIINM